MAGIVMLNLGLHGHINPTLAVARALVEAGDRVDYFAPPSFAGSIAATGATFHAYHSVFSESVPGHMDSQGRTPMPVRLISECRQVLPQIAAQVAACAPDVLAFDVMCVAGRVLGQTLGIPTARLASTFLLNATIPWTPRVARDPGALAFFDGAVGELVATYGIAPFGLQDVFNEAAPCNVVFTIRDFQPSPASFDDRFHFVGASLAPGQDGGDAKDGDARAAASGVAPLVYVALGTLANARPDFYRLCLTALASGTPKRGLVAVGRTIAATALGPVPATVEVVAHAPQLEVLQRASAFVSHAGMNSVMEALHFGVPLLLFPQTDEQVVNAERLAELGAGINLGPELPTAAAVAAALEVLLREPGYRQRARELSGRVRDAGGALRAAAALREYAHRQV